MTRAQALESESWVDTCPLNYFRLYDFGQETKQALNTGPVTNDSEFRNIYI